jgi:acyl dehydratase
MNVRFIAPVRSGKRVRGRFVLKALATRSPGVVQSTLAVTVEIEQEPKPALVAEWLTLAYLQHSACAARCCPAGREHERL